MPERFDFLLPTWRDAIEIVVVAFVIYRVLRFLVGTRALQIVFGLLVLAATYVAAFLLDFRMITYLLGVLFTYGAFAALVVFQPEVRSALARLGQQRVFGVFAPARAGVVAEHMAEAVERLSRASTGAILVVEKEMPLDEYVASGITMQATVSADLLTTIFTPYSPLHDGAVVVRADQIVGAACILPLTQSQLADRSLGTRHRAALGLSEETDALAVVVSEETATISLAVAGRLYRGLTPQQVHEVLSGRSPIELALTP